MGNAQSPQTNSRFITAARFFSLYSLHPFIDSNASSFWSDSMITAELLLRMSSKISSRCSSPSPLNQIAVGNSYRLLFSKSVSLCFLHCRYGWFLILLFTDCLGFCCLQSFFGLRGPLGERLFDLVTQKRKDQKLTYEDLVVAKVSHFGVSLFFKFSVYSEHYVSSIS